MNISAAVDAYYDKVWEDTRKREDQEAAIDEEARVSISDAEWLAAHVGVGYECELVMAAWEDNGGSVPISCDLKITHEDPSDPHSPYVLDDDFYRAVAEIAGYVVDCTPSDLPSNLSESVGFLLYEVRKMMNCSRQAYTATAQGITTRPGA